MARLPLGDDVRAAAVLLLWCAFGIAAGHAIVAAHRGGWGLSVGLVVGLAVREFQRIIDRHL